MARRLNFTQSEKDFIVLNLQQHYMTVTQVANCYGCHPRSIDRVMEQAGVIPITSKGKSSSQTNKNTDTQRIKELLKQHNLTVDQLTIRLAAPMLTPVNVQRYLNNCSKQELATHFYSSGLVKLAELSAQINGRQQQIAALLQPTTTKPAGANAATELADGTQVTPLHGTNGIAVPA